MTNQTFAGSTAPSNAVEAAPVAAVPTVAATYQARVLEALKSHYPLDQQAEFLRLQAEADLLLQQLQMLKQQRQAVASRV